MAGATNYALKANKCLAAAEEALDDFDNAESAQVLATMAVAYATLAVFTATGNG